MLFLSHQSAAVEEVAIFHFIAHMATSLALGFIVNCFLSSFVDVFFFLIVESVVGLMHAE